MLKLYYTTTKGKDELQPKFYNSLGGYKSATPVKNDEFDNFFGELSSYTISNNSENQYIGLILINEGDSKTNISVYFSRGENCYSKLYIAAVDLVTDENGDKFMESVPTINSSPLYAEFVEAEGVENSVNIGDIDSGESVGIWLKREILRNIIIADHSIVAETDPQDENRVVPVVRDRSDTIDIVFSYD